MNARPENDEAHGEVGNEAEQDSKLSPHNTTAENQRAIILQALRTGPKTTVELRHQFGIMSPAPRIFELRRAHQIDTVFVRAETPDSINHVCVAKYVLQRDSDLFSEVTQ